MPDSLAMSIEIRTVAPDELQAFIAATATAFLEPPVGPGAGDEVRELWDLRRAHAAFEGRAIVGTFRTWATELTVPGGGQVPAGATTNVTVLPTHRRQGILTRLAAAEHAAARDRGDLLAVLFASEFPIYGRFGYGPAAPMATWELRTRETRFLGDAPPGRVELVQPDWSGLATVRAIYDACRRSGTGEIQRPDDRHELDFGLRPNARWPVWRGYLAVRRDSGGTADGYARYRTENLWEHGQPKGRIRVDDLHALTDAAYAALWRHLGEADLAASVTAGFRSPAERLPWLLTNARAAAMTQRDEGMWVRLFDLPRALEARAYEASGSLVLEIVDPELPAGRCRLALDASPDGATARPSTRSPDVTLAVGALGAAYLGGTKLADAVLAGGAEEHRASALADATRLFRTLAEPWSSTYF